MKTRTEFEKVFREIFGKRSLHWSPYSVQFKIDRISFEKIEQLRNISIIKDVVFMPQAVTSIPQYPTFLVEITFSLILLPT